MNNKTIVTINIRKLFIVVSIGILLFCGYHTAYALVTFGDFPLGTDSWIVDFNDGAVQGHSPGQNGTGLLQQAYPGTNGVLYWIDLNTTAYGGAIASPFGTTNLAGESQLYFRVAFSGADPSITFHFFSQSGAGYTFIGSSDVSQAADGVFHTYSFPVNNTFFSDTTNVKAVGIEVRAHSSIVTTYIDYAKTLQPLAITTNSLPNGTLGFSYSQMIQASGGTPSYSWTTSSGSLPTGLILATNGAITGTPTSIGLFNFNIRVTDSLSATTTQSLSIAVSSTLPGNIFNINPLSNPVGQYEKYEVQFDLYTSYSNPFDPTQIDIQGIFTSPTGKISTTYGFYFQNYSVSGGGVGSDESYSAVGSPKWVLRFAPLEIGNYSYVITAQDTSGIGQSTTLHFSAISSSNKGFVRINPNNRKYFMFDNGEMYFPIGQNVDWSGFSLSPSLQGITSARYYFSRMSSNHENWDRFWMTDFDRNAIEWTGGLYPGLGKYALPFGYRVDQILEAAKSKGIYVQLVINQHGQFSSYVDAEWASNPYNSANGGPCSSTSPADFFSNPTAKNLFKQRARYLVARWGYQPNLLAWELFNEVEYIGSSGNNMGNNAATVSAVTSWHIEMAQYIRSLDCTRHLITTSSDDPGSGLNSAFATIWNDSNFDICEGHYYGTNRENSIRSNVARQQNSFNKPTLMAEFGIGSSPENNFNPSTFAGTQAQKDHLIQGTHLHNAIWTAAMTESMAALWWWDSYMEPNSTLNRNAPQFPLNYHFIPLDIFMHLSLDTISSPTENLPTYGLKTAGITVAGSVKAFGLSTSTRAYIWFRDTANEYESGQEPGDIAGRNISGASLTISGLSPSTTFIVQYFSTYSSGGYTGVKTSVNSSAGGQVVLFLPTFQKDMAVKLVVGTLTRIEDWNQYALEESFSRMKSVK